LENLTASLNTALYMLLVMGIGRITTQKMPERELVISQINKLVFSIFLPMMIFKNIYTADLKAVFDGKLLLYLLAFFCGAWLVLLVLAPKWIEDRQKCGAFIQGSIRSNSVVFGLPIVSGLFLGQDLGCPTIITAITTVEFNVIGVITLELFRGSHPDIKKIVRNLLRNPILIASVFAIVLVLLEVQLPACLTQTVNAMAGMGSPMGLLLIGANLHLGLEKCEKSLIVSILLRLGVIPAIGLFGAVLLGWRGIELCTVLITAAAPTSVSAYSMARAMDSDAVFAANQVGLSSILGAGTVFLWSMLLSALHLL